MVKKILIASALFMVFFLCTFPGAQDPVKSTILLSKCVGCGDCVRACPVKAITMQRGKAVIDPDKCVGCRLCIVTCSYGAPR